MTHINAFYADVEDKKLAVVRAQGELEAAQAALEAHPDYVREVEVAPDAEKSKPKSK